ncbi:5'/3'-nucleotidase SurE [Actinomycetospora termitidis]|uniref:5'-nucleotidase n=1 Tax=Actinomycetospora termitidis TaxID=3053470 RepID=A0ABT7M358_9PSEU|nr:5'/3'-nucleotidase SurE [Actinomycetospora sp. Odt1-22]MDL5154467.1 5'/3'-nucleotidase SurE [Actinomycetospora sp. Odt1-22]
MTTRRLVLALATLLLSAACAATPPPAPAPAPAPAPRALAAPAPPTTTPAPAPLRVLLTDDDGWQAGGITAVRKALTDAGYDVTLVAPESNRSGAGASSDGKTELDEKSPKTYAVGGMPVDAVRAGLELMRADPPDLVVSGTNLGHNSGTGIVESGTVGAAVIAATAGIPAIASSTHKGESEGDCTATAAYVTRLVQTLGPDLFAPGTVVNVNYPAGERADEVRVRDPLAVELDGEEMTVPTDGPDDDVDILDDGVATLTQLTVGGATSNAVVDRLRDVPA